MSKIVTKRDGKTRQAFSSSKIYKAIVAAWNSVDKVDEFVVKQIVESVETSITASAEAHEVTVEEIQDEVELTLMRSLPEVAKAYILFRQKRREARKKRPNTDGSLIADYIHVSKYARYREDLERRETFTETVARVEAMHVRKFPALEKEIRFAFDFVRDKRVLPSMRSMQFGGVAIEDVNCRIFNCCSTLVNRPEVFGQALYLLLAGCGVGYSIQECHVSELPVIATIGNEVYHHVIEDTIQGWADGLRALIHSYMVFGSPMYGAHVEFSYHLIRDRGVPLKTSGGRAPGHLQLKTSLECIRGVLQGAKERKLRPIECHRILCHAADAVLSGGIRRSAMIALFSVNDTEMVSCKSDASWFTNEPWLANANNSVVAVRSEIQEDDFRRLFSSARLYGEPGTVFVEDATHTYNPCQPAWATVLTPKGISTIGQIKIGDQIWSGRQWTTVTDKQYTGQKQVNAYRTVGGTFYGTEDHRVVQNGLKIAVKNARSIDTCPFPGLTFSETCEVRRIETMSVEDVYDITVEADEHTYWSDGLLVSNCSEIGKDSVYINELGSHLYGWAFCNLCEINGAKIKSKDDFWHAAKAATLIGTLQASYTDMPYLGPISKRIAQRDALLGIGITGMQDSPEFTLNPELQREISNQIVNWNQEYAALIGINPAARTTCVKPSGTTSLELNSVGSGIHPHHARRYIRRVTADELEIPFQAFRQVNPHACIRKPDGKWVIEFAVEAPLGATIKSDLTAIEFLNQVKSTQENWVLPGTARESRIPGLRHNVSNTITVKSHEWDVVADYLWENRNILTGVSVLADDGDTVYPFAPFEAVKTEAQERRWKELATLSKPVDYSIVSELEDTTNLAGEAACGGGSCELKI